MKRKLMTTIFVCAFFLGTMQAYALTVGAPDVNVWGVLDPTTFSVHSGYDYGDAVGYGEAKNLRGRWQGLGTDNSIDDGVKWSVGGSAFGTDADLIIGEEVTFKFLYWQLNNGRHTYDQIYAAFDFGQDGYFSKPGDNILYEQVNTNNPPVIDDKTRTNSDYTEFTLSLVIPETMKIGTTWMRIRSTCWHTPYPDVTAYNYLNQGETEDYQLNIRAVPEPATMLLLGTGLIGLAGLRRRFKK